MKLVSKVIGKVIQLNNPPNLSSVLLKDSNTNKELETTADTYKLLEKNINKNGDEFEILIWQSIDENISVDFIKLDPNAYLGEEI